MTFIHPRKNWNIVNYALMGLVCAVAAGAMTLIMLYNHTVGFSHGASANREEARKVEAINAELKERILSSFAPDEIGKFALSYGLVPEKNPQYVEISKKWNFALDF